MIVRSGPARVVAAGVVTTFGGHPLTIEADLDGRPVVVTLSFDHAPGAPAAVRSAPIEHGWALVCVNFDGGRGTAEPMLVGELGAELVLLHFRAHRYGTSADTTVQFTLFRVPKDAVNWVPGRSAGAR